MNTDKEYSQRLNPPAQSLILGCCTLLFTACNGAPTHTAAAEPAYGDWSAAPAESGTMTPANAPQTPLRDELDAGIAGADEMAAIQNIASGANPRAAIKRYVSAMQMPPESQMLSSAKVIFIDPSAYSRTFPKRLFYVVRFRQWPVAVRPPAPLASNNLFVFEQGKPLRLIASNRQLQEYFSQTPVTPGGEEAARLVLTSWLTLSAEFAQDGMLHFKLPSIESVRTTAAGTYEAKGRIAVESKNGDAGDIAASITVDSRGKLVSAHTEQNLKAGIRPICQATKLLDPDPLVRRMAERDLLMMGRSARDYLFQQRSKASAELQAEIDRLWRQIIREGR